MFRRISRSLTDDFRSTKKQFDLFFCFWDFQYVEIKHTKNAVFMMFCFMCYICYIFRFSMYLMQNCLMSYFGWTGKTGAKG